MTADESSDEDRLVGCPTCSAIVRSVDDGPTLRDHRIGGFRDEAECPASGTAGIDLGPMEGWQYEGRHLLFVGVRGGEKMPIQCPRCKRESSVPAPPDGAFDRRLSVVIECPDRFCQQLIYLNNLREGPQGRWVTR